MFDLPRLEVGDLAYSLQDGAFAVVVDIQKAGSGIWHYEMLWFPWHCYPARKGIVEAPMFDAWWKKVPE